MWDWSKNQIEIIFLRHGMTIENEQHRYLGNTDTSLSRNGICKLQALQKSYADAPRKVAVSAQFTMQIGKPAVLEVMDEEGRSVRVESDALSKPYANIHTGVERNGFWRI